MQVGTVLWIDPRKISLLLTEPRAITKSDRLIEAGDWDEPQPVTFEQTGVFRAFEEHFLNDRAWQQTDFYKRAARQIERGTMKWGCHNASDLDARLAGIDALFASIQRDGYKTQRELGLKAKDEVIVAIRRDGRFMFGNGQHRLSIAKLLCLKSIPVRVVRSHTDWETFKGLVRSYANDPKRGGKVYQRIDHPDLVNVPAHHGDERMTMIRTALKGKIANGRTLLDIGTHWGTMGRFMETLGYAATGIESNKTCVKFARALAVATESNMRVEQRSIFDLPDVERFDTVLALNIFHHFIKTQELHETLRAFLRRLRASTIIFEPHRHDPPGQMRGAWRNYTPQEFCAFVAENTGLGDIRHIGDAEDGRPLFLLTAGR